MKNKKLSIVSVIFIVCAIIGAIGGVYTVMSYYVTKQSIAQIKPKPESANPSTEKNNQNPIIRDSHKPKHIQIPPVDNKKTMPEKVEKPAQPIINATNSNVLTGTVNGNVNQTVNVNEAIPPEWSISISEQISEAEWRTKLSAKARGRLPYANWNLLLTLNTPVLRREDVNGEVSVGPWMPLNTIGGNLKPNNFFIGFSQFNIGQYLSIYLYSKEPIKVLHVESLSE